MRKTLQETVYGNRRRVILALLVSTALLLVMSLLAGPAQGADYSFEVPEESLKVRINDDSSADFWYLIEFENDAGASPIDVVDIGMPTSDYDIGACEAAVNGKALDDIRPSTVVSPGVEVHLDGNAIRPGDTGIFEFHGRCPSMVYRDSSREGYASFKFMNTWWDSRYAHGNTRLTFSIQFPRGVLPNETIYHDQQYDTYSESDGCVVFTWVRTDAKPSEGYTYGVSFPAAYVEGVSPTQPSIDYTPPQQQSTYSSYGGSSRSWWYYLLFLGVPAFAALFKGLVSVKRIKSSGVKPNYITPSIGVEGAGPMKELWPTEAAVLMSLDLDRVAAVAYFEMMQRGLVTIKQTKPTVLQKVASVPESVPAYYRDFIAAIKPEGDLDRKTLKLALTHLIKSVESKTKGFSHAETKKHYEEAAKRSWLAVKTEVDHSKRMEKFNKYLPYLLLDPGFGSRVREAFSAGAFPVEGWAIGIARASEKGPGAVASAEGRLTMEGSVFADSVAEGFRSVRDSAYTHVDEMQDEILKEVNPVEYRRYRRYVHGTGYGWGGSGGGCACACACAGCACACAGGGR